MGLWTLVFLALVVGVAAGASWRHAVLVRSGSQYWLMYRSSVWRAEGWALGNNSAGAKEYLRDYVDAVVAAAPGTWYYCTKVTTVWRLPLWVPLVLLTGAAGWLLFVGKGERTDAGRGGPGAQDVAVLGGACPSESGSTKRFWDFARVGIGAAAMLISLAIAFVWFDSLHGRTHYINIRDRVHVFFEPGRLEVFQHPSPDYRLEWLFGGLSPIEKDYHRSPWWWPGLIPTEVGKPGTQIPYWMMLLPAVLCAVCLLRREDFLWRRTRRVRRGLCEHCGHDRWGLTRVTRCPECGGLPGEVRVVRPAAWRRRLVWAAATLASAAVLGAWFDSLRRADPWFGPYQRPLALTEYWHIVVLPGCVDVFSDWSSRNASESHYASEEFRRLGIEHNIACVLKPESSEQFPWWRPGRVPALVWSPGFRVPFWLVLLPPLACSAWLWCGCAPRVRWWRTDNGRGVCNECGYDRRGLAAGAACPECGEVSKALAAGSDEAVSPSNPESPAA